MTAKIDRRGLRYGKLTVLKDRSEARSKTRWLCVCDCGVRLIVTSNNLVSCGTSCGCVKIKHNAYGTKEYKAWLSMKKHCYYKKHDSYRYYGGRGIRVCEAWRHDFTAFLNHVGLAPSPKHSIDRKDVNGHYQPGNVRWATASEQQRNKRK